jgi:hypothetical protein
MTSWQKNLDFTRISGGIWGKGFPEIIGGLLEVDWRFRFIDVS